jgi:hypothetical protein
MMCSPSSVPGRGVRLMAPGVTGKAVASPETGVISAGIGGRIAFGYRSEIVRGKPAAFTTGIGQ